MARARVRRHVWTQLAAGPAGFPVSKVAGTDLGDVIVLDVDATIVIAHSAKELALPRIKKTFGFHPRAVSCDNTTKMRAGMLHTGRRAPTPLRSITVLGEAIAQVPAAHRKRIWCVGGLVRVPGHDLLDWLTDLGKVRGRHLDHLVEFSVPEKVREAIKLVPNTMWTPAVDAEARGP